MMNHQSTQPIQTIDPQLPHQNPPQAPVAPTASLSWVILLTLCLSKVGIAINATTGLMRSVTALWIMVAKIRRSASKKKSTPCPSEQDESKS